MALLKHHKNTLITLTVLICGFLIGSFIFPHIPRSISNSIRENNSEYKFINPVLLVTGSGKNLNEYFSLKTKINSYIDSAKSSNQANSVSVYFRDLNSGRWTGIDENEKYTPASMLKVAVLIAYLRKVETDPAILSKQIKVSAKSFDLDAVQTYKPRDPVVPGKTYSINQLLTKMIVDSDNNANAILMETLASSSLNKLYEDLDLPINDEGTVEYISPESYSRFFRVLYNSSYLSHSISEKTLEILSNTNFATGLKAGVPNNIVVSHKFGERTTVDQDKKPIERELHDCGIVYYPEHPYFICVMTKGTDFKALEGVIKDISKITWDDVQGVNK